MPSLDDLKKRIKSVKSTQKITKAMKMVAAAKLRKAQESAEKGRPYSQKMQNIILNLTKSINDPQNAPKLLVGTGEDKKYLCVVLTADRGLCGGFNSNICKLAKTNFKKILSEGKELNIITAGSKGHDQIKREYGKYKTQIKGKNIERCLSYKYLGVYVDEKLDWKTHVKYICEKVGRVSGMLARLRHCVAIHLLKEVYFALVSSHLSYCNIAWGDANKTTLKPLVKLQNKIIKIISFSPFGTNDTDYLFTNLKLLNLDQIHT